MAEKRIVWKQEKENKRTGQWWLRALLISIFQLLLVWGSRQVTFNVLGLSGEVSLRFCLLILLLTVVISFWNEWSVQIGLKKKAIGNGLLLIGLVFVLGLAYSSVLSELAEGFQALGNTYLSRWNAHSGTFRAESSRAAMLENTTEIILLLIMSLMQMFGGMVKRRSVVLAIPVSIICMGLMVMAVPEWSDLAFLLLSGVLLLFSDSSDSISWKRLVVLSAGGLLLLSIAGSFQEEAQKQMLSMNEDWFDFWENKGKDIEDIFDFELSQWVVDRDVIDNTAPKFKDKQVILLTTGKQLTGSIYLRGYHCKDYVDGAWEKDTKAFEEACEEYGISEEEAAENLLLFQHEKENIFDNQQVTYELSYTGIKSEYCYFPYGSGWEDIPEDFELSQDYLIRKNRNKKEGKAIGWKYLYHLNAGADIPYEYSSLQDWYDEFAYENYLTVPDEQKAVKKLAREMNKEAQFSTYTVSLKPGQSSYEEVNAARLQIAYLVAGWLRNQGTYSLELDELPTGTDAVEYFLATSHEGYCEHFASAGTLILRELGVPARYTTGYIAGSGTMKASGGKYTASILDSAAHAWTEVYLENYGWVPIEMTPGYSGNMEIMPEFTPTVTQVPDETMEPPTDMNPEETETPTQAPTELPTEETNDEKPVDEKSQEDEASKDEQQEGEGNAFRPLIFLLLVGTVVGLGFVGYRYMVWNKGRSRKRLNGYMRRGENRKAVKWINEEIYRQLVYKGRKFNGITDAELLLALKSEFPEVEESRWDAYFEVVRKAVYSVNEISAEEMEECYALYKVVRQSRKQER